MSKKKKNKKKRLDSLILLLFLTVVLLTTATYAWFTSNRNVTIDDIDVNVAAASGLQISTDALNWKTIVSNNDIITGYTVSDPAGVGSPVADTNVFTLQDGKDLLAPVSTIGTVSNGKLQMYKGTVEAAPGTGVLSLSSVVSPETSADGDFIAFDVFLKVDQPGPVYLDVGSGVVGADTADVTKGLANSARMAFIVGGNAPSTSSQYALVSLSGGSSAIFYEPNYDSHTSYGVSQAQAYYTDYDYGTGKTAADLTAGNDNEAIKTDGLGVEIATSSAIALANTNATDNSSSFTTITPQIKTKTEFTTSTTDTPIELFTLAAGVTKVRIYMWIEGQDVDCENNASGSNLTYKLALTLDRQD